jgi:hypothetical protein
LFSYFPYYSFHLVSFLGPVIWHWPWYVTVLRKGIPTIT